MNKEIIKSGVEKGWENTTIQDIIIMSKTLIIYYSQTGQSKKIAEMLGNKLQADLSEIITVRTYNDDMWKDDEEAKAELKAGKLPELTGSIPDISDYDTVIIGGPVWGRLFQVLCFPICKK